MYHVKRSDPTIESALIAALGVVPTAHSYTLNHKESGAIRGVYITAAEARTAGPNVVGPKGTYQVTAVHPVGCFCSPMDLVMDGED